MMILLCVLAACGSSENEDNVAHLQLVSSFWADDAAIVGDGAVAPVAVKTRAGPRAVFDTDLDNSGRPYGLPKYIAKASGLNGHAGFRLVRTDFPRYAFEGPIVSHPGNWLIAWVSVPDTAVGTPTTRGYWEGWTMTPNLHAEGTRFIYAQNANTGGEFIYHGYFVDDLNFEPIPPANRGWHRFQDSRGQSIQATVGPQVNVLVVSDKYNPYWIRNRKLLGVGLPGMYGPYQRGPTAKAVMWSEHAADGIGGSTATYASGDWYMRDLYEIISGQPPLEQAMAICGELQGIFNVPDDP